MTGPTIGRTDGAIRATCYGERESGNAQIAVVGDGRVGTRVVLAAHDVPAEGRRAAALDRAHHLELAEAHVPFVGLTPSGPVVAQDIRDLQGCRPMRDRVMPAAPPAGSVSRSRGLITVRSTLVATWV